jgi:hypothetical protein
LPTTKASRGSTESYWNFELDYSVKQTTQNALNEVIKIAGNGKIKSELRIVTRRLNVSYTVKT